MKTFSLVYPVLSTFVNKRRSHFKPYDRPSLISIKPCGFYRALDGFVSVRQQAYEDSPLDMDEKNFDMSVNRLESC